jgi:hypothetical protein
MTNKTTAPDLFATIGNVPGKLEDSSAALTQATQLAEEVATKAEIADLALAEREESMNSAVALVEQQLEALRKGNDFDLWKIIHGRYDKKVVAYAEQQVELRSANMPSLNTVASFGTTNIDVAAFVNSSQTRAEGEARLAIADTLDVLYNVSNDIIEDENVQGAEIKKKAEKMLADYHAKKRFLSITFNWLFKKTLNRVVDYRKRLLDNAQDLGAQSVEIDRIDASLLARQHLLRKELVETCINGLSLQNLMIEAQEELFRLEKAHSKEKDAAARSSLNSQIKSQRGLVQIMVKRLFDLKSSALEEINMDSITDDTRIGFAIIKADVDYSRTKVIANLGFMLGLVVEIVTGLRYAQSAKDVRNAKNRAVEKLSGSAAILQQVTNEILTDVESGLKALDIMTEATVNGIQNNRENMARVVAMHTASNQRFNDLLTKIGNA